VTTVGVGVDIVDVARFRLALERHPKLLERLFTEQERLDTKLAPERLAARFAAKEAVLKTLSSGLGAAAWHNIEVRRSPSGAPSIQLHGAAAQLASTQGVTELHVSLSHTNQLAAAFVVGSATTTPDRAG
jgi:holo-[acyl-carrier protein] synthase